MNFVLEKRGYCNNDEEEDEQELINNNIPLPFSSLSSPPSSKHKTIPNPPHQYPWLIPSDSQQAPAVCTDPMDLTLGSNNGKSSSGHDDDNNFVQKEHMFDKVVTPSDVGKLNRLVIPKQHAEKYFPLDFSSDEKGLLLNFEDRNGKSWRFRYSYWNSSQSYVMTKGWSRFVKEKKLDAGDIVSFQRGLGDLGKGRLFIDWRRRPNPDTSGHFHLQNPYLTFVPPSLRWERLYSLPETAPFSKNLEPLQLLPLHYGVHNYPCDLHQQQQLGTIVYGNVSPLCLRSSSVPNGLRIGSRAVEEAAGRGDSMAIDSVPILVPGNKTAADKTLRLFGVNMECASEADSPSPSSSSASTVTPPALRVQSEYPEKGKSSSSLDLDL